jgi:hypothetical protein
MDKLQRLREALEQQRKYERENWPFVDDNDESTGTGESITYHLASLYCWSPGYVLSLPPERRDAMLQEVWRTFSIAGDIIHRYEEATEALKGDFDVAASVSTIETAIQLLTGNILNLRTELLVIKAAVVKEQGASDE